MIYKLRRRVTAMLAVGLFAAAFAVTAACSSGPAAEPTATQAPTATATQTAPTATSVPPTSTTTPPAPTTVAPTATTAAMGTNRVQARNGAQVGDYLADGSGRTMYIFDRDTENVSNCTGGCLANWPPVIVDGSAQAGSGVTATLGTLNRADGTKQLTVNGYPAYYWQGDANTGDTLGNGVGGNWWVFEPNGEPRRPAKVGTADDASLGTILVDGAGRTLYVFDKDTAGASNCSGTCLVNWPPLLTDYSPVALNGVGGQVGTITRDDGTKQVTVNGFPVYYWKGDAGAGDTFGNGVGGNWWVIEADGSARRPAKVGLADNATIGKQILVDGAGRTLYLFDSDTVGVSNCTGGCLSNWPPLLTDYPPAALTGVTGEIGTITRADGTMQVTINGLPVYYWVGDAAAGDVNGQGVGGKWWVMGASGAKITN